MARDRTLLSEDEVRRWLAGHGGWTRVAGQLVRRYDFPRFAEGIAFVQRIAVIADAEDHHPDIDIRYCQVTVRLMTHDAGGLTARDPRLAERCDAAYPG